MSEPENFLTRWSRRKLEVEQENARTDDADQPREPSPSVRPRESGDPEPHRVMEPHKEATESAALDSRLRGNERGKNADESKDQPFDITTLPSLESITAKTDISVFLQKGVPAELTRAALRRAWSADPNIRDFIEIAENQWDFATASDLPGFGSLDASADDIRQLVAEVFGEVRRPVAPIEKPAAGGAETASESERSGDAGGSVQPTEAAAVAGGSQEQLPVNEAADPRTESIVQGNKVDIASQQNSSDSEYSPLPPRRPHGRALPQ